MMVGKCRGRPYKRANGPNHSGTSLLRFSVSMGNEYTDGSPNLARGSGVSWGGGSPRITSGPALAGLLSLAVGCSFHSLDYLSGDEGSASRAGNSSGSVTSGGGPSSAGGAGGSWTGGRAPGGGAAVGASAGDASGGSGSAGVPVAVPDCGDGQSTVDETDVDCGGRTCSPCTTGAHCFAGTDCASAICTNQACQPASCTDLAVNGDETDLNCGGTCAPCPLGRHCARGDDCQSGRCANDMCESATCQTGALEVGCPLLVDNTPYSLAPSQAPQRCLDDNQLSVNDGNAMLLWSCRLELQQTFWAVGRPEGYFALRNALSGKCLQVRGESLSEGAVVEQFACRDAPAQRWTPVRVNASHMRLANDFSGLYLGVAGPVFDQDAQAIVQGAANGPADTAWSVQKRTTAAYVRLSPRADKALSLRHQGGEVTLADADDEPSHWRVMPGLADARDISLQSRDEPGRYLRHANFRLWSDTNDGSAQFQQDATFRYAAPLVGTHAFTRSLRSHNFADRHLLRSGTVVELKPSTDSAENKDAATWWVLGR